MTFFNFLYTVTAVNGTSVTAVGGIKLQNLLESGRPIGIDDLNSGDHLRVVKERRFDENESGVWGNKLGGHFTE
jgi:hypothetical protein